MEQVKSSGDNDEWRQAWRTFADQFSGRSRDTHSEAAPATQPQPTGGREEGFQGFGSPQGKF